MIQSDILYEPLVVSRWGAHLPSRRLVWAEDPGPTCFMLEEFISLGVTRIILPKSYREVSIQLPPLISRRIRLIDDEVERQAAANVCGPVIREFAGELANGGLDVLFDLRRVPHSIAHAVTTLHHGLYRLAVGFNHRTQVGLDLPSLRNAVSDLRDVVRGSRGRSVLAQVEGVLAAFSATQFESPTLRCTNVEGLTSIFDALVNDPAYQRFASGVRALAFPRTREAALSKIRGAIRTLLKNPRFDLIAGMALRTVEAWTGKRMPELPAARQFLTFRSLPIIVDLTLARHRALDRWVASPNSRSLGSQREGFLWTPATAALVRQPSGVYVGTDDAAELLRSMESIIQILRRT